MSDKTCSVDINLDVLRTAAPFILAVDGNLKVTWASSAFLRRFTGAVGRRASELVAFDGPGEEVTSQSIQASLGRLRKLALQDGDPPTPLSGQWVPAGGKPGATTKAKRGKAAADDGGAAEGFVLLAVPRVSGQDVLNLSLFQFDDFPSDGAMIDLLVLRDRYGAALRSAEKSIRDLQRRYRGSETARHRSERSRTRMQKESHEPCRLEAAIPMTQDFEFQVKLQSISATAVFTLDEDRNFTSVNDAFCAITGFSEREVLGKSRDVLEEEPCEIYDASRQEVISRNQCRIRTRDGRTLTVLMSSGSVCDDSGEVTGTVEAFTDVTGLVRAISEEENAGRARTELVVNRSRSVNDSLLGIREVLGLLLHSDLRDEQREILESALFSTETAADLNDDILSFAGIDGDRLELESSEFGLRGALRDALKRPFLLAGEKGLMLECHVSPYVPDGLVGDATQLRRILTNLVSNAVACTERGEVAVNVATESQSDGEISLHVSVADTGAGMAHEKTAQIRELLAGESLLTQADSGTLGLGLLISARLAESMGGSLWFESEQGKGSTFHFKVRFKLGETSAEDAAPQEPVLDIIGANLEERRAAPATPARVMAPGWRTGTMYGGAVAKEREPVSINVRPASPTSISGFPSQGVGPGSQPTASAVDNHTSAPEVESPSATAVAQAELTAKQEAAALKEAAAQAAAMREAAAQEAEAQEAEAQEAAAREAAEHEAALIEAALKEAEEQEAAAQEAAAQEAAAREAEKETALKEAEAREAAAREAAAKEAAEKAAAEKVAAEKAAAEKEAAEKKAAEEAAEKEAAEKEAAEKKAAEEAAEKEAAEKAAAEKEAAEKAAAEKEAAAKEAAKLEAAELKAAMKEAAAAEAALREAALKEEAARKAEAKDDDSKSDGTSDKDALMDLADIDLEEDDEDFEEDPLVDMPVLVVDDDRKNRLSLKKMLMSWRMKPTVVNGGRAALAALWQAHETAKPYQLILLDAEMPEMDGFMIAEKIKRNPEIKGARIIMLTSNDELVDASTCREMGISGCLWMPVKPKSLLEKIKAVMEEEPEPEDTGAEAGVEEGKADGEKDKPDEEKS